MLQGQAKGRAARHGLFVRLWSSSAFQWLFLHLLSSRSHFSIYRARKTCGQDSHSSETGLKIKSEAPCSKEVRPSGQVGDIWMVQEPMVGSAAPGTIQLLIEVVEVSGPSWQR